MLVRIEGTDTILKIAPEIMKKINLFFLILILLSLWTFSCQKEEENAPIAPNEATIANLTKGMQNGILTIRVGHSAKECNGCIPVGDKLVHVGCSGYGTLCEITARVSIIDNGLQVSAVTTDTFGLTTLDYFNMPARSLAVEDENEKYYLNIPAQMLYRDSKTLQFTLTGLFYSAEAYYENN
mgnify:FL=1